MERLLVADLAAASRNWALTPDSERRLLAEAPSGWRVHVVRAPTSSDGDGPKDPSPEVMQAVADAEAYFGFGVPRPLFLVGKRLRWVHSAAAGVGSALYPEMVNSDVQFTNSAGVHAIPIAEYVIAGVLHFLRGLDIAADQQRRHLWSKKPFVAVDAPLREVDEVHAVIVGARCTAVRRRRELGVPLGFDRVAGPDDLDQLLPGADVLVVAAPLTGETRGLFTAERLDRLPRSAIVVNVARGALVDEAALAARIGDGRLRGAVLDVFEHEPLAEDSPLWQLRSVIVTPHVSPVSPGRFWPRQLDLFLDNWRRYVDGRPLRNLVDKHAGY